MSATTAEQGVKLHTVRERHLVTLTVTVDLSDDPLSLELVRAQVEGLSNEDGTWYATPTQHLRIRGGTVTDLGA